ncbi:MAG: hypothetical protein DI551_06790 [Micavibrio aeruginosavorus]|uniref:Proline iminopeptidase n=1 Tax=Micavibrio aeruginosavorus TaxID=349221 RepID=A0A2W5MZS4_9BACT|nr:MAG: hypothetical protein DI551_06790 [Micavibrio aeruginosavorus]
MYAEIKPYDEGFLDVGDGYSLAYGRFGNPGGPKIIYLHGGPGAGCAWNEYRYFDPSYYDVVLFDQRGSGKSVPLGERKANSTDCLVGDIEKLRTYFGYDRWIVAGGSWGSCLAMEYAAKHADRIDRMLLRGIFFGDKEGAEYIPEGDAYTRDNVWFREYEALVPDDLKEKSLSYAYYEMLDRGENLAMEAAIRFNRWNASLATSIPRVDLIEEVEENLAETLANSRMYFHFAVNEFFHQKRERLLDVMKNFKGAVDIVHGRQDYICSVENAYQLDAVCPNSHLHVIENCGHSMAEPLLKEAFVRISDGWKLAV